MAGPMTRAPLNMEEFNAIAFIKSSRETISMRKDWRPGISKAFTAPRSAASVMISQVFTMCNKVSAASTKASSMEATWVPMTIFWRFQRSAAKPPSGDRIKIGIWPANPTTPRSSEEPVMR
jgi:hypothetical protein